MLAWNIILKTTKEKKNRYIRLHKNLKPLCFEGHYQESDKTIHTNEKKHLAITYLLRDQYPKIYKDSYSITKRQTNQLKYEQRI